MIIVYTVDATSGADGLLLYKEPLRRIHRAQEPANTNYHATLCEEGRHCQRDHR